MKTSSNIKLQQEQRELRQTEDFLKHLNINYTDLTQVAKDPPDFSLVINNKKIALEHTSLYDKNGGKDKQHEVLKEHIVTEISSLYYQENLIPISVFFVFNKQLHLSGEKKRFIAKLLEFFRAIQDDIPIKDYDSVSPK